MFAKRFFFVCAGLLCLALAYHQGARAATAQTPAPIVGFTSDAGVLVMAQNGDMYFRGANLGCGEGQPVCFTSPPYRVGNFWKL